MPRQNIIFAIVAPLVLMAVVAVIVISIGETLLAVHHWAGHLYHVGEYPTPEEKSTTTFTGTSVCCCSCLAGGAPPPA